MAQNAPSAYQSLWHGPQTPTRIVLHATDGTNDGQSVAQGWLNGRNKDGSPQRYGAQVVINQDGTVTRVVPDDQVAWSTGGNNTGTLAIEIVGTASQSRQDWMRNPAQLQAVANQIRQWTQQYKIPLTFDTSHGISTHAMNSRLYAGSEGHWDPGPGFPLQQVISAATGGSYVPTPQATADALASPSSQMPYPDALKQQGSATSAPQVTPTALPPANVPPPAPTAGDPRLSLLYSLLAKHPHLDPQAVLAVASTEGLDGGIGDGGHAFGPFQLNNAGGIYPSQAPQDPQAANQWAWSKQGINYALNGIKDVAAGLKGPDAIRAIVGNKQIGGSYGGFERPADEGGEITKALGRYGHMPTITPGAPLPAGPPVSRGLPQAPAGTSSLPPSIVAQLASRQPVRPQLAPNLVLALGKLLGGLK